MSADRTSISPPPVFTTSQATIVALVWIVCATAAIGSIYLALEAFLSQATAAGSALLCISGLSLLLIYLTWLITGKGETNATA